jgi:hypothetical protein
MATNHLVILTSQLYLQVTLLPFRLINQFMRVRPVVAPSHFSKSSLSLPPLFSMGLTAGPHTDYPCNWNTT